MSHKEQQEYFESIKEKFPDRFTGKTVLDIGSFDVNGTNEYLFTDCEFTGIDLEDGPGVDVVCEAQKYDAPDESYDVIISSECLEHNPYYKETLENAVRMLKPGGFMLFACATTGRPVHGLASQQEDMLRNDPTWTVMQSAKHEDWDVEYYKNFISGVLKND